MRPIRPRNFVGGVRIRNVSAPCCFVLTPCLYVHRESGTHLFGKYSMVALGFKLGSYGWALEIWRGTQG